MHQKPKNLRLDVKRFFSEPPYIQFGLFHLKNIHLKIYNILIFSKNNLPN